MVLNHLKEFSYKEVKPHENPVKGQLNFLLIVLNVTTKVFPSQYINLPNNLQTYLTYKDKGVLSIQL